MRIIKINGLQRRFYGLFILWADFEAIEGRALRHPVGGALARRSGGGGGVLLAVGSGCGSDGCKSPCGLWSTMCVTSGVPWSAHDQAARVGRPSVNSCAPQVRSIPVPAAGQVKMASRKRPATSRRKLPNAISSARRVILCASATPNLVVSIEVGMVSAKAMSDTNPREPGGSPS